MDIDLDIACRPCQIGGNQGTAGAYNLFGCADCRVRYVLDCVERLSPNQHESNKTKDKLFEELLKWQAEQ